MADAEAVFDTPSALPGQPREDVAERWLCDVRRTHWEET